MALFDLLGYNFTDTNGDISTFNDKVKRQLDNAPPLLKGWQVTDLEEGNNSGYYQNPCANVIPLLGNTCNTILTTLSTVTGSSSYWPDVRANATTVGTSTPDFLRHTNRLSGVEPLLPAEEGNADLPHYETAVAVGKSVMYYIYQSDGTQDNSAILGNFTSILIANTLYEYANTLNSINTEIVNSLEVYYEPISESYLYTSNLSDSRVQTISSTINTASTLISTRQQHDVNFFLNSRQLVEDAKKLRQFSNPGMSETHLLNNYIATDKLKTRLAQN